jgi:hypothetical protein
VVKAREVFQTSDQGPGYLYVHLPWPSGEYSRVFDTCALVPTMVALQIVPRLQWEVCGHSSGLFNELAQSALIKCICFEVTCLHPLLYRWDRPNAGALWGLWML